MTAWRKWLQSLPSFDPEDSAVQYGLDDVRHEALKVLGDCKGPECDRLRRRLEGAPTANELWMLRGTMFQLVASQHCQAVAAARINALVPLFREFLPARLVTPV